jgi:hypothetical protein
MLFICSSFDVMVVDICCTFQDHPKDDEFLNQPLQHYPQMQVIWQWSGYLEVCYGLK